MPSFDEFSSQIQEASLDELGVWIDVPARGLGTTVELTCPADAIEDLLGKLHISTTAEIKPSTARLVWHKQFGQQAAKGSAGGLEINVNAAIKFGELLGLSDELSSLNPVLEQLQISYVFSSEESKTSQKSDSEFTINATFSHGTGESLSEFVVSGIHQTTSDQVQTKLLAGSVTSPSGSALSLGEDFPIDISVKDLVFAKISSGARQPANTTLLASDLSAHGDFSLASVPLVGQFLSEAKFDFQALRFVNLDSTGDAGNQSHVTPATLLKINSLLTRLGISRITSPVSHTPNSAPQNNSYPLGTTLEGTIKVGSHVIPLHHHFDAGTHNAGKSGSKQTQPYSPGKTSHPGTPAPVGNQFGPVKILSVNLGMADGKIQISFSGGIQLGPFAMNFMGFEIRSPTDEFQPSISLQGLGLSIQNPPLKLCGQFLKGTVNVPVADYQSHHASDLRLHDGANLLRNDDALDLTPNSEVATGSESELINLEISNEGSDPLVVKAISSSRQDFVVNCPSLPATIEAKASPLKLGIKFKPSATGFVQGSLSIESSDTNLPKLQVTLNANGDSSTPGPQKTVPVAAYDGSLAINFNQYSLSAIGSYAQLPGGDVSTFMYGFLGAPIGGPPFLFITGAAAGFGLNRSITLPSAEHINTFPLIQPALPQSKPVSFDAMNLEFAPEKGEFWGAVGIRAESFGMAETFVVLDVQFGNELEIDILGLSTMNFPKPPPDDPAAKPLAKINLGIVARILPDAGVAEVTGAFLPGSYILNPMAHVSGGFAVLSVFKTQNSGQWRGAAAGDFLVTLGGYANNYPIPNYYPRVPRLELNWRVSSALYVKADAYFALTPGAMMAGGHLVAHFHEGGALSITVNFQLGADFLIEWKPYHYTADFYADLEVIASISLDLWLFTLHASVDMDLGADLDIWGPDFSGSGTVHLHVLITFSAHVSFGHASLEPPPLSWGDFQSTLLPSPDKIVTTSISEGLIPGMSDHDHHVINAKELELRCSTSIPAKVLKFNGVQQTLPGSYHDDFGIKPMHKTKSDIQVSELDITITDMQTNKPDSQHFHAAPLANNLPGAVWQSYDPSKKVSVMPDTLSGAVIKLNPPTPEKPFTADVPQWDLISMPDSSQIAAMTAADAYPKKLCKLGT